MTCAPLVLFVYNRPEHTIKTLEAINLNYLAPFTSLYIFSDGIKNDVDLKKVNQVRSIIKKFSEKNNMKSVYIKESKMNRGLADSIITGVTEVISKHSAVIVLEDDLITAKNFLNFMNDALEYYKENKKIWSIGGTSFQMDALKNYPYDVYACYRAESWGWATWQNRWDDIDWDIKDYDQFLKDKREKKYFLRGGADILDMLAMQREGKIDSWAIRWCYNQSRRKMWTILPVQSRVYNIGMDGSGTHCQEDVFHTSMGLQDWQYKLQNVEINEKVMRDYRKYFHRPFYQKLLDKLYLYWQRRC